MNEEVMKAFIKLVTHFKIKQVGLCRISWSSKKRNTSEEATLIAQEKEV